MNKKTVGPKVLSRCAYYYLAHFSKFVRPGATRVETKGNASGIRVISFATPEGGIVAQVLNSNPEDKTVNLVQKGKTIALRAPAQSISTLQW